MNKLFTKIAAAFVGMAMAIGVGVAVGDNNVKSAKAADDTIVFADLSLENGVQYSDPFDGGDFTITFSGGGNDGKYYDTGSGIRLYGGGVATVESSKTITTIEFTWDGNNKPTSDVANPTGYNSSTSTWSGSATSVVFTRPSGSGHWRMKSVAVTYSSGGGSQKTKLTTPILSRNESIISWTADANADHYEIKVGTANWVATDSNSQHTLSLTPSKFYSIQVKAVAAQNDESYTDSDPSAALSFDTLIGAGTEGNPYTVADAIAVIDKGENLTGKYATGIVSAIPTAYSTQYSNITFNLVDTKGDTAFLQAFRCAGDDAADVKVDDIAVVSGTLKKYNSTYEFDTGCTLVFLTHPTGSITISFNSDGGEDPESITRDNGQTFTFPGAGTKENFVFKGWSIDEGAHVYAEGATSPAVTENVTYTAIWQTEGNSNNPYTVAEARAAITSGLGVKNVHVSGIVSEINEEYSTQHSNITFSFSADGETTSDQMKAYRCVGDDAADVGVGDTVKVKGDLILHNTDYELAQGCQLVTLEHPEVTTYTLTYDANGGTGTMTDSNSPYNSGTSVTTLTNTFTRNGYTFAHWNTAANGSGTDYEEGESFNISENTTLYAIWNQNGGGSVVAARCYTLVESASDLVVGAKYIIASDSNTALSTTQNSNNRAEETILVENKVAVVTSDGVQVVTLEAGESSGEWAFNVGDGYLYAASSSKNYLRTQAENDANGSWTISLGNDGAATVTAQGTNSRNILKYNSSDKLFSCYASGQKDVYLYRLSFEATLLHNVVCDGNGSHALPNDYTWNADLKGVFDDLPSAEQLALKTASNDGLARYDYIIGKYNPTGKTQDTNYLNFIGRTIVPLNSSRIITDSVLGNNNTSIIIVVVSMTSVLALGGFFFIKKRKEQ